MNITFVILVFVSCFLGLSESYAGQRPNPNPKFLDRGREIFLQNCTVCHGPQGEGDGPAAKVTNPKPRNYKKDKFRFGTRPEQLFKTITQGIDKTPMPSWQTLPEADRWAVAYYVHSLIPKVKTSQKK